MRQISPHSSLSFQLTFAPSVKACLITLAAEICSHNRHFQGSSNRDWFFSRAEFAVSFPTQQGATSFIRRWDPSFLSTFYPPPITRHIFASAAIRRPNRRFRRPPKRMISPAAATPLFGRHFRRPPKRDRFPQRQESAVAVDISPAVRRAPGSPRGPNPPTSRHFRRTSMRN